jgi:hypothetical protein
LHETTSPWAIWDASFWCIASSDIEAMVEVLGVWSREGGDVSPTSARSSSIQMACFPSSTVVSHKEERKRKKASKRRKLPKESPSPTPPSKNKSSQY